MFKTVDLGVEMERSSSSSSRNGGDVRNLMFKTVEIDGKLFYFQLKEEMCKDGKQFIIISNKVNSSGTKYSIVLPSPSISTFLESFHACISSHQHHQFLLHNNKVKFTFDIGHNHWGTYLKVSESSVDKYQGTTSIFIPSGRNQNEGWETFGRALTEISTTSKLIFPPKQQNSDSSEQVVGLPDVSACIISGESDESSSASQLKTESSLDESSSFGISRMMRAGPSTFVFDLQGKKSSPSLRISQLMGTSRSSIFVPLSAGKQFHEMVGDFLKIFNDFDEGSSVADGEQSSSPQVC